MCQQLAYACLASTHSVRKPSSRQQLCHAQEAKAGRPLKSAVKYARSRYHKTLHLADVAENLSSQSMVRSFLVYRFILTSKLLPIEGRISLSIRYAITIGHIIHLFCAMRMTISSLAILSKPFTGEFPYLVETICLR